MNYHFANPLVAWLYEIEGYFILFFRQYNYYHRSATVGEEFNTNLCIHSQSVRLGPPTSLCLYAYQGMWETNNMGHSLHTLLHVMSNVYSEKQLKDI